MVSPKVVQIAVVGWEEETDETGIQYHHENLYALLDDGRIFVRQAGGRKPAVFIEIPAGQMPWMQAGKS
jgi:hypothetical protein